MDWREREGLTSVPTHESTGMGTYDQFLSTVLLSTTALGAVVPKQLQRGNKHFNILDKKPHLWFPITNVKPV